MQKTCALGHEQFSNPPNMSAVADPASESQATAGPGPPGTNPAPPSQTQGHPSFRRYGLIAINTNVGITDRHDIGKEPVARAR